jgi:hypothetical protein
MLKRSMAVRAAALGFVIATLLSATGCLEAARDGLISGVEDGVNNVVVEAFERFFE